MLDAHCHLVPSYFSEDDIDEIIQRSAQMGIKLFPVASNVMDFQFLTNGKFKLPFVGVHPVQNGIAVTAKDLEAAEPEMDLLLASNRAFGIGEIGIDYQKHIITNEMDKNQMAKVFRQQLIMASRYDCFVNVHSRQAGHYALEIMHDLRVDKAILHAFDGNPKYALAAIAKNPLYFFTIPGSVQRDEQTRKLAMILPLENMLVESDAPSLGPVKGQIATPLDIPGTIAFIAELRSISAKNLSEILELNFQRILKANKAKIH